MAGQWLALGLGESGSFPASPKTVDEWFPKKERALVLPAESLSAPPSPRLADDGGAFVGGFPELIDINPRLHLRQTKERPILYTTPGA